MADARRAPRGAGPCRWPPRIATAMPRSKCGPRLGRSAGESRTVMRRVFGHVEPAVDDRRPAAVARLGDRRVRPTDEGGPDQPVGQVDLDVDHVADGSLQRHRVRGGDHQPTPRTCSISGRAPLGEQHPDEVDPDAAGVPAVLLDPAHRELPQPLTLGRATASSGWPYVAELRVLTSQNTSTSPVTQDEVDLAEVAAPVAVDEDHPLVDEPLGGDALAVGAEVAVAWTAAHARQHTSPAGRAGTSLVNACGRRPS